MLDYLKIDFKVLCSIILTFLYIGGSIAIVVIVESFPSLFTVVDGVEESIMAFAEFRSRK